MLSSSHSLEHEQNYGFGMDALVTVCSDTGLGMDALLIALEHERNDGLCGCTGYRMLLGNERNYCLSMMHCLPYALGTRTKFPLHLPKTPRINPM